MRKAYYDVVVTRLPGGGQRPSGKAIRFLIRSLSRLAAAGADVKLRIREQVKGYGDVGYTDPDGFTDGWGR